MDSRCTGSERFVNGEDGRVVVSDVGWGVWIRQVAWRCGLEGNL